MTEPLISILTTTTAVILLAYVVLWSWLQTFNANPTKRFIAIWLKLILYYASYTMPFWAVLTVVGWTYGLTPQLMGLTTSAVLLILTAMGLYFYTVVVQPNRLRLHHQAIDLSLDNPLTIAVLADLRIGLYSGKPRHIRKLITTINELSVDAVLITGDWLYYPGADLVGQMMLFKGVNKPIYTVMSISDLRYQSMNTNKQGKPLLEDTLASAFDILDITYIGQQCWPLPADALTVEQTANAKKPVSSTKEADKKVEQQHDTFDSKQRDPDAESGLAMLCGWQDLPNRSAKQASDEVNKMQEVATENPLDCYQKVENYKAPRLLDDKMLSKTELSQEVIVTANKAELCEAIKQALLPVIILASRFDSITDLPNGLQPRPLLIAGAAKKTKSQALTREQRRSASVDEDSQTIFSTFNSKFSKRGLYQHGSAQVFVSSGIGTRGLPFRLYRPTIDVLTIR